MPGTPVSLLSLHYPPDATGIAPYAGALAAGLQKRAHPVTAYVAHPFYPEWEIRPGYGQWKRTEIIDGVTVCRLRHYVPRPPRGLRRLISELSLGCRMLFCRFAPDTVVVAVSPALFATALMAIRIRLTPTSTRPRFVVWVQDLYTLGMVETKEGGGFSASITKFVERHTFHAADRVVAIHPRFADYMVQHLNVEPENITMIRNWTHLRPAAPMRRQDARDALGWSNGVQLVVHTGNMGAKQGLENVVKAARLADEIQAPIKFILVGDGSERSQLEMLAKGIERIEFVDPLGAAEYRCALAAADCLLVNELPGVASMAVPSKLTSYFDAMRPVLAATDVNGITAEEVNLAGAGVVVAAGNPRLLLEAALDILSDGEVAAAYGAAGYCYRTEVLNADAAVRSFEALIRELTSLHGVPRSEA